MRVPDDLLKGSVYLVYRDGGQTKVGGTAFLLGTRDPWVLYVVTARHCVLNAERYGGLGIAVNVRNDTKRGALWFEGAQWYFPESEADDVAVMPIPRFDDILPEFDVFPYFIDYWPVTDQIQRDAGIGVGDEIIVCGLFTQSVGKKQNRPIIRSGIISAMPGEELQDRSNGFSYQAYLAEIRSMGGLSGSPVFVVVPPERGKDDEVRGVRRTSFLLGLIRGHWEIDPEDVGASTDEEREQFNTGIAIVTPIQRALDVILRTDELIEDRKRQKKVQDGWEKKIEE